MTHDDVKLRACGRTQASARKPRRGKRKRISFSPLVRLILFPFSPFAALTSRREPVPLMPRDRKEPRRGARVKEVDRPGEESRSPRAERVSTRRASRALLALIYDVTGPPRVRRLRRSAVPRPFLYGLLSQSRRGHKVNIRHQRTAGSAGRSQPATIQRRRERRLHRRTTYVKNQLPCGCTNYRVHARSTDLSCHTVSSKSGDSRAAPRGRSVARRFSTKPFATMIEDKAETI